METIVLNNVDTTLLMKHREALMGLTMATGLNQEQRAACEGMVNLFNDLVDAGYTCESCGALLQTVGSCDFGKLYHCTDCQGGQNV